MSEIVERIARALAARHGDDWDHLPNDKPHWTAQRGQFGGRFRDVNERFKCDYIDEAESAVVVLTAPQSALDSSPLFDVILTELTEGHLALDRLGAPRTIEGDDFIHDLKIAERIQTITTGLGLSGKPQDVAEPPAPIADTSTESAASADSASSLGERDPLVTMDSGAADTCPAGFNPGWLLGTMDRIRDELDTPPNPSVNPRSRNS